MRREVAVGLGATFIALLLSPLLLSAASAKRQNPFCAGPDCRQTRSRLKNLCDFIVKEKSAFPTIYIGGYYMRDLVDGYEIFGNRRYLTTAIAYGDFLLKRQMPNGFWASGYGTVYLADTGSALGLLIALYHHVDHGRQKKYFGAVQRYVDSLEKNGMIHRNGALGTGWWHVKDGVMTGPIRDPYTLSSALTGGEVFTWMYQATGQDRYREVAYRALKWVLSTQRRDGNIPYILAMEGADWTKRGNPRNDYNLWEKMTYGTSAYVGEGILSFALHCGRPAWSEWIGKAAKPNIEFLLRTQLPDGTWSKQSAESWDRTRSPGIVNYLIWYYQHVDQDPRVAQAVRRFDAFIIHPENGKAFGLLNDGAVPIGREGSNSFNTATSLTARALAGMVSPGVDSRW
ncbi:MAG TPA: hypothetical protein VMW54_10150 [Terriglobia bacterium]|nr:hypothetical protein [Terriglobia bacterium]